MEKCQKWEWDKYFVTMTSRDITYSLGLRKVKKVFKHLVRANFGMFSQRLHVFFTLIDLRSAIFVYSGACKAKSAGDSDGSAPKLSATGNMRRV